MSKSETSSTKSWGRRDLLKSSLWAGAASSLAAVGATSGSVKQALAAEADQPTGVRHGRIKQSIVQWCFGSHWSLEQTCEIARKLGVPSVELVGPGQWPTLKKHGLTCAITGSHSFVQGMNNPKYHAGCVAKLRESIDASAEAGVPTVITFTGFAQETGDWNNGQAPNLDAFRDPGTAVISREDGIRNCVAGYKQIVGYAEKKGVKIALEMLNSRVDENMKGHPGYQGDHTDYCMEIIRQVGSPAFGLLFDIYHVQIMDGDVIRRIHECGEAIHHVHTAGNPGRNELDDRQEINYPPILRALLEIGYQGYVGQEFIPTRDPLQSLTEAVQLCDIA
jgi:hydroxypyruvate isomerase